MRVAGDEVQGAHGGRTEIRTERIVAHGVSLSIIPKRGDRVTVEIIHDLTGSASFRHAGELYELVHQTFVESLLFSHVVMVLVGSVDMRAVQALRLQLVRIARNECLMHSNDRRCICLSVPTLLAYQ